MLKLKAMKKYLSILVIAILGVSCSAFWTYRSLIEFKHFEWQKENHLEFEFPIEQQQKSDVLLLFRHVHGFPFATVYLEVSLEGPEVSSIDTVELSIIGDDREYLGEGSGDIWDVESVVYADIELVPGDYHISVRHIMERDKLDLVMEVGVQVSKPKE